MALLLLEGPPHSSTHSGIKRKSPSVADAAQEPPFKKHRSINGINYLDSVSSDDGERAASPPLIMFAAQLMGNEDEDDDEDEDEDYDDCSDSFYLHSPRRMRVVLNPDIIQGLQCLIPSETLNPFYDRFMDSGCRLNLWPNDENDDHQSEDSAVTEPVSDCSAASDSVIPANLTEELRCDQNINSLSSFTKIASDIVSTRHGDDVKKKGAESGDGAEVDEDEEMKRGSVEGGGPPISDSKDSAANIQSEVMLPEADSVSDARVNEEVEVEVDVEERGKHQETEDGNESEKKREIEREDECGDNECNGKAQGDGDENKAVVHDEADCMEHAVDSQMQIAEVDGNDVEMANAMKEISTRTERECAESAHCSDTEIQRVEAVGAPSSAHCHFESEDEGHWKGDGIEEVVEAEYDQMEELDHAPRGNQSVIELLSDDTESDEVMANNAPNGAAAEHGSDAVGGDDRSGPPAPWSMKERERERELQSVPAVHDKQTEFMRYPPKSPKPVIVTIGDIGRLRPETYLNDSLIDFYLKYVYEELLDEGQRAEVFCFNQFFFTKLDQAIDEKNEKLRLKLAKWTKSKNIFEHSLVIIPINISLHWSLCVMTNPGHCGPITRVEQPHCDGVEAVCRGILDDVISRKVLLEPQWVRELETDCRVQAISKHPTKLLHFDSMRGCHPSFEIFDKVRQFMDDEWRRQYPSRPRSFTKSTVPGVSLGVPQQTNSADCGVYLLHFAELFCLNPFYDAGGCLTRDSWFSQNVVTRKRTEMKALCQRLRREQGKADLDVDSILDRLRITVESQSGFNPHSAPFQSIPCSVFDGGLNGHRLSMGLSGNNGYGSLHGLHGDDYDEEAEEIGADDDGSEDSEFAYFEDRLWEADAEALKEKLASYSLGNVRLRRIVDDILTEIDDENRAMAIKRQLNGQLYHTK